MSKQPSQSKQIEDWSEFYLTEWVSAYKQYIIFGLIALLALIMLAYRVLATSSVHAEADYFQAQYEFAQFQDKSLEGDVKDGEHLDKLEIILNRHPDLHAKYDSQIAQLLIINQDPAEAKPFVERTLNRVTSDHDHLNLYREYAQTSLLISEGQYEQAVIQAEQLKDKMSQNTEQNYGSTLYTFNLIRLATLYQELNRPEQEQKTWEEFKRTQADAEAAFAVDQLFQGSRAFDHYMKERLTGQ